MLLEYTLFSSLLSSVCAFSSLSRINVRLLLDNGKWTVIPKNFETSPPLYWVQICVPRVKRPERKVDLSPLSSSEVQNCWICRLLSLCCFMACAEQLYFYILRVFRILDDYPVYSCVFMFTLGSAVVSFAPLYRMDSKAFLRIYCDTQTCEAENVPSSLLSVWLTKADITSRASSLLVMLG